MFDLPRVEVKNRAFAGVFYITSSSVVNLLIGFLGNLALARLLTPSDFGIIAIGLTVTLVGGVLADGGLGSGLVRRTEAPHRWELRTLMGIQLAIALAICLPVAAIALSFGPEGAVMAVMVAALPIGMLQMPGRVVLARSMRFDRQAVVDFVSQTSFYVFSVVAVALGAGVWGLAIGTVVRAVVEVVTTGALSIGLLLPSLRRWREFGELSRFGLRFQATPLAYIGREQILNAVTAAIAGVAVLGLWSLASRLAQVPTLAFRSLWAIGYPAMSNLIANGEDVGPIILRTVRRAAIMGALVFPVFAAYEPGARPAPVRRAVAGGGGGDPVDRALDAGPGLDLGRDERLPLGRGPARSGGPGRGRLRRRLDRGHGPVAAGARRSGRGRGQPGRCPRGSRLPRSSDPPVRRRDRVPAACSCRWRSRPPRAPRGGSCARAAPRASGSPSPPVRSRSGSPSRAC